MRGPGGTGGGVRGAGGIVLAEAQAICADPAACADELASAGVETDFPSMELSGVPDKLTALDAVLCAQGQPVK